MCSEILKKNPSKLLHNFCRHVLSMKSSENSMQEVYYVLLSRPLEDNYSSEDENNNEYENEYEDEY